MQTFVIDSEAEWQRWRPSWDALVSVNPMCSMDWLNAWWQSFGAGHQLHIIAVAIEDRLVGVVPCYRHSNVLGTQLRFLGSGVVSSDYLSAVVDTECRSQVYEQIANHFADSPTTASYRHLAAFHFEGMTSDDPWLGRLRELAKQSGYSFHAKSIVQSWRLPLPSSWEQFVASQRGRGAQRKAKKCTARVDGGEVVVRDIDSVDGVDEGMSHLVRLHQARRESLGDSGCFSDPRFEVFLRNAMVPMVAKGQASFRLCELNGSVIGVLLLLKNAKGAFMYQSGVNPAFMDVEPGHILIATGIKQSISENKQFFDFLRGDEPYKAFWGAEPISLQKVTMTPPTIKAQLIDVVHRKLSWAKSFCQSFGVASALGGMMAIT